MKQALNDATPKVPQMDFFEIMEETKLMVRQTTAMGS